MTAYGTDDSGGYRNLESSNALPVSGGTHISSNINNTNTIDERLHDRTVMTIDERLHDIQIREQRVLDLERELDEKENKLQTKSKKIRRPPNWPFPGYCAFARHDIGTDIPSKYQNHVRKFYSLWWLVSLCACLNWLCIVWYGAVKNKTSFTLYLVCTLYVVVGAPTSWMFWYKRYYRAMQRYGNLSYMFFVFFGLQILFSGLMAAGFVSMSSAGALLTLQEFVSDEGNFPLAMCMGVNTILWGLSCFVGIYLLKLAHFDLGQFLAKKYEKQFGDKNKQRTNTNSTGGF